MSKEQQNKLHNLLEKDMPAEYFALIVRRFKQEAIKLVLQADSDDFNKEWISEGHYWLTELCEILDPHLEKE